MSEMPKPNVGTSLLIVHHAVTRGLNVSAEQGQAFAREGLAGESLLEGYGNYVRSLVSFLRGHHLTEDELIYPYFRDRLPEAPFDALMREHQALEDLMAVTESALGAVEASPGSQEAWEELAWALDRVRDLWQPHIAVEEEHFAPQVLGPMLPPEEHARLLGLSAQHSQKNSGPDYLVVPFFLFNLAPQERAVIVQSMPPIIIEQLVPVVWKEKWESMKPFLLD